MLSVATSLFSRSAIFQSYSLDTHATGQASSSSSGSSSPFQTGLWKVQPATHKASHLNLQQIRLVDLRMYLLLLQTTSKRVSIWSFDKRAPEIERLNQLGKERVFEYMKAEVDTNHCCTPSRLTVKPGASLEKDETPLYP